LCRYAKEIKSWDRIGSREKATLDCIVQENAAMEKNGVPALADIARNL
jgi:hypothetical protein